jgi:hypothetical protein
MTFLKDAFRNAEGYIGPLETAGRLGDFQHARGSEVKARRAYALRSLVAAESI